MLLMTGCQMNSAPRGLKGGDITYFRDSRTDLCFAAINSNASGYNVTSITNVPCTDLVNKAIAGGS